MLADDLALTGVRISYDALMNAPYVFGDTPGGSGGKVRSFSAMKRVTASATVIPLLFGTAWPVRNAMNRASTYSSAASHVVIPSDAR